MRALENAYTYLRDLTKREIDYLGVRPTHALLFMTYRCTGQCKMCTIWQRVLPGATAKELTLEQWKECVDQLCERKIQVIELFGGDALLRKDVCIPLIEYIRRKGDDIIIDFPTNCNLLDEKTARSLVRAGVSRLYVSLDGLADVHDTVRGTEGTFHKVERALRYLASAKKDNGGWTPEIICNCTISSLNVEGFEAIIPFAERMGADCVEFEYVGEIKKDSIEQTNIYGLSPTPFYVSQGFSVLLNRTQALLLKKKMRHIRRMSRNVGIRVSTRHVDVLSVDDLVRGTIPNKKCYICRYMVSIDPSGNIMGCLHFNNYHFGNILVSPLLSIWNNSLHRDFMQFQRQGKIAICRHCISGVHRNSSFFQSLFRKAFLLHQ